MDTSPRFSQATSFPSRSVSIRALAASLFHFGELTVPQVKDYLNSRAIPVR